MAFEKVEIGPCTLYRGDCLEILPELSSVDTVITDPPYLTGEACVPIRGKGVSERVNDSTSIGNPWGYSLNWVAAARSIGVSQWVVFANYKMLGGVCTEIDPTTVFVWRKSNAPRMTRPVPRLDSEFIVWGRGLRGCGTMGMFDSMVIDIPMLQAGCFATERVLDPHSGKAAHPCQKPVAVVEPFVERLDADIVLDPYMGSGTTGVACINLGRKFIGIEKDPKYFDICCKRMEKALLEDSRGFFNLNKLARKPKPTTFFDLVPSKKPK